MTYIDIEAMVQRESEYRVDAFGSLHNLSLEEVAKEIKKLIRKYGKDAVFNSYDSEGDAADFYIGYARRETDEEFKERKEKSLSV